MITKITTFYNNKGGVGKTFIALNTAMALSLARQRVLLLELNFQSGHDIDKMLRIPAPYGLINLAPSLPQAASPEIIKKAVSSHKSGLDYLPAILDINQIAHFDPLTLNAFFKLAGEIYDHIIIDAPRAFSEALITVFENSNLVILVATPDTLSIEKLKWCIEMFNEMGLPQEMFKLVLNRAHSEIGLKGEKVQEHLSLDILAKIPSDGKTVGLSLNTGVPCVLNSPRSEVSKALSALAQELMQNELFTTAQTVDRAQVTGAFGSPGAIWKKLGLKGQKSDKSQSFLAQEEDKELALKAEIQQSLIEVMEIDNLSPETLADKEQTAELRMKATTIVDGILREKDPVLARDEAKRKAMAKDIVAEAFGLGALEDYLEDSEISDIMVNSQRQVFIEKGGKLTLTPARFSSEGQMRSIIDRIISPLGRRIDESTPMVDARLQDGSRFNAIIPPLSLTGPVITIRKFGRERPTVDDLLNKFNSLNQNMRDFLESCVIGRKNIIVSGGTGSGKTTLLNIISTFIPDKERIVTIEDAAELRINKRHWIRLESRPANVEGKGRIPIRTLFLNSLHMRPDRIIVGECRGSEILDMLQAMNTGHDGSMTTLHANSTKDVLVRMSSMILLAGVDLPIRAINEMISTALDVIVHVNRFADGTRKIVEISEVTGLTEDHYLDMKDIFKFEQTGKEADGKITGYYTGTGYIPKCFEEFKVSGIPISEEMFKPEKPQAKPDAKPE